MQQGFKGLTQVHTQGTVFRSTEGKLGQSWLLKQGGVRVSSVYRLSQVPGYGVY